MPSPRPRRAGRASQPAPRVASRSSASSVSKRTSPLQGPSPALNASSSRPALASARPPPGQEPPPPLHPPPPPPRHPPGRPEHPPRRRQPHPRLRPPCLALLLEEPVGQATGCREGDVLVMTGEALAGVGGG